MEAQKIVNLLNGSDNESSEFARKKWYIINDQNNRQYGNEDKDGTAIKFETKVNKSNLCNYSNAYILVTGNITVAIGNADTKVAFKNCTSFIRCVTHINDEHVETAENLDIIMPMYNLLGYSDNYADSSGSLWQFKRDEQNMNGENTADVTTADSSSSIYKSSLFKDIKNGVLQDVKIVAPLKYLSNIFRSLEMPLINFKTHLELNWTKHCIMSNIAGVTRFRITRTKLYVPILTLSTKDNVNLTKQLNEGFKRFVYWNEYKSKIETKAADNTIGNDDANNDLPINNIANRLQRDSHRKYFLPRVDITNYNVLIDGRNFYDQPINDQIRNYDETRKITTGKGDDYTTGCVLDYQYFKNHYKLIAVDLYKQKELDANPRSIQQIEFYGMLKTN